MEQISIKEDKTRGKNTAFSVQLSFKFIHLQFGILLHRTPLIAAAANGKAPILELLIKYNASLDLQTGIDDKLQFPFVVGHPLEVT